MENEIKGIKCPECKDTVWSRSRHDMRYCKCGYCAVDGGRDYFKITYGREGEDKPQVPEVINVFKEIAPENLNIDHEWLDGPCPIVDAEPNEYLKKVWETYKTTEVYKDMVTEDKKELVRVVLDMDNAGEGGGIYELRQYKTGRDEYVEVLYSKIGDVWSAKLAGTLHFTWSLGNSTAYQEGEHELNIWDYMMMARYEKKYNNYDCNEDRFQIDVTAEFKKPKQE